MKYFNPLSVSSKFAICGLPIRLDTYKQCSFNCQYCFANNRINEKKENNQCNVNWLKKKFKKIYDEKNINQKDFLENLLNQRITLHGGGQSDCFQPCEEEKMITKKVVEICNEYDQHILFSTKSDTYYDVPVNPKLHSFQLSITNLHDDFIEPNVPSIENRIKFFDSLKQEGFKVGIRIQPFIPELTNIESIFYCFDDADHFTIEGLKLVPQNMDKNKEILEYIGLCDEDFKQMGLLNLYPDIRLWYYKPVIEFFEDNNISYSIADNDLHYLTNNYCCCGDKLIETQTTFHNTFLFKKYNHYGLNDVFKELGTLKDCKCNGLFTSNRIGDCVTVEDFYNERFCKKSSPFSPSFSYFEYNRCLDEWI